MYLILYNPLSKSGKNKKIIHKAERILSEKNESFNEMDITKIGDMNEFIKEMDPLIKILIIGGDGTMHYLVNYLYQKNVQNEIFFFGSGTGNDFVRNAESKDVFIRINEYLNDLPTIYFKGTSQRFINGVGMGLDAYVCNCVNSGSGKNPIEYKLNTIKAFLTNPKFDLELVVDGVKETHTDVWLISIMNAPYQGGGMKFAPEANIKDDYLHICMVEKRSRPGVLWLFPKIFKGNHCKYVYMKRCQSVKIKAKNKVFLQLDGEVVSDIDEIEVKR